MYEIDKVKFGAFVSELRKEKGITQKELAGKLFISDKAISKWETGHSVPDITLLVPLAEVLDVTVTELLECKKIEKAESLNVEQAEDLVKKVIGLSEEEKGIRPQFDMKKAILFFGALLISVLQLLVLHHMEYMQYFEIFVGFTVGMCALFGAYFWFFIKEKLPAYYDENKINVYVDGMMHMNMPGVYFNNSNWPYIVKAVRIWSLLGMTVFPIAFVVLSSMLSKYRPTSDVLLTLIFILGGLFIPIYTLGRKHMYTAESIRIEHEANVKKGKSAILAVVVILVILLVTGNIGVTRSQALRIKSKEFATKTQWSVEHQFCDGYMSRTMQAANEEDVQIVVVTEEGNISIKIEDMDGNVIFEQEEIQSGNYPVKLDGKYKVRVEFEDHRGSFYIGN